MISVLNGKIISKTPTDVVIDCMGVGYQAYISVMTSERIPAAGETVRLFTILIPREDALNLYGFRDEQERDIFRLLISVSGVGAKTAMGILSSLELAELQEYIITENSAALSKLPGIGKKTAGRVIIDLKDKIGIIDTGLTEIPGDSIKMIMDEAVSALTTLGYSQASSVKSVKKAVDSIGEDNITAEILIKTALKFAISK